MAIAGLAVGANKGYIYVRSEYPHAIAALNAALKNAGDWLGDFSIEVRKAAGAYVCGEETAMLESIEGKRGIVRSKPPLPAISGLFGQPTVINNVITFASVPDILAQGAAFYRDLGVGRSRGTLPFQLAGNIKFGGLVEVPFGCTLRELLYDYGGGSRSGRPLRAVQVGGPLGAYLPESQFDTVLDYEAFAAIGAVLGHGGIVAFDDTVDMAKQARYAMKFCALESCGKCTPCRIGSTRGVEVIDRIRAGASEQIPLLRNLCDTMTFGSMCAMGSMTPYPGAVGAQSFSGGLQMNDLDYGTPAVVADREVTLNIDGVAVSVPAGTSVMRAAVKAGVMIPKLCATDSLAAFRFLPPVPGRDRRPARLSVLLHDTRRSGHESAHAIGEARRSAPQCDGAVHLRPSARLPDLFRQRQLRTADHGRYGRPARSALRHGGREPLHRREEG